MTDEAEVLEWLIQQQSTVGDEDIVESVDKDELDIMMRNVDYLLVLYHDRKKRSQKALNALESIDDDCDEIGISFVEVDKQDVAFYHGVEEFPTLVFYKDEIPAVFEGLSFNLIFAESELIGKLRLQLLASKTEM